MPRRVGQDVATTGEAEGVGVGTMTGVGDACGTLVSSETRGSEAVGRSRVQAASETSASAALQAIRVRDWVIDISS